MSSVRTILFGSGAVGKTAIAERFLYHEFRNGVYNPTLEESCVTDVRIDGEQHRVDVIDSPGQEEYSPLRDHFMRMGDGFLLVYDITNQSSFNELEEFYQRIVRVRDSNDPFPCVVCGNKCDLESERQVPREEGQKFAESKGCPFFETSAKEALNVEEAFISLCRLVLLNRQTEMNDNDDKKASGKKDKSKCIIC